MSHSSFSEAYHANCLADYEKLHHKMDHYQSNTHPLPDSHHATIHPWTPKFHFPQPSDWHHPDPTLPLAPSPQHHFHFPPLSTHALTSRLRGSISGSVDNVSHLAQPAAPLPTFRLHETPPWAPSTDIRETKHAYHIEIELPGVTDKQATTIQWLERGTLLVRGEIPRPDVHHDRDRDRRVDAEKLDGDWCSLTATHAPDALTKENTLTRSFSTAEQEAARESSAAAPATDAPTFLLRERNVGEWQRSFTLPLDVDAMGMKATLSGGLLEILLMKRCVDMGKVVHVEVG